MNLDSDRPYAIFSKEDLDCLKKKLSETGTRSIQAPPNMSAGHYKDMNILTGNRIGIEYKQKNLDKLSELYADGYLTSEEYDKRAEWIHDAQTAQQIEIVFTDLQRALLSVKVNNYSAENKSHRDSVPAFTAVLLIAGILIAAIGGSWVTVTVLTVEMIVMLILIFSGTKRTR